MARFRKRPVVIEAVTVRELLSRGNLSTLPVWAREALLEGVIELHDGWATIFTLEGTHRGDVDDIVIRGVKGELYPCKPDIFAATYEAVD